MTPPMSASELYRVEKIRPALVRRYIIESALLFYSYHRSMPGPSTLLDIRLNFSSL